MKTIRHNAILEIVSENAVETQEMLRAKLLERGIEATQATLSRDINELGLVKNEDRYCLPDKRTLSLPQIIIDSVKEIDYAMNTVVFKCLAGTAMAVCAAFDSTDSGAVGTLAGDDTIFILMRSEKEAVSFVKDMRSVIFKEKR